MYYMYIYTNVYLVTFVSMQTHEQTHNLYRDLRKVKETLQQRFRDFWNTKKKLGCRVIFYIFERTEQTHDGTCSDGHL